MTDNRSTAMHSAIPSSSMNTAMIKNESFKRNLNDSSGSGSTTKFRLGFGGAAGVTPTAFKKPVVPRKQPAATKTSAYMSRYGAKNKSAAFWGELTKIAEKAGKIEAVDTKLNRRGPDAKEA